MSVQQIHAILMPHVTIRLVVFYAPVIAISKEMDLVVLSYVKTGFSCLRKMVLFVVSMKIADCKIIEISWKLCLKCPVTDLTI